MPESSDFKIHASSPFQCLQFRVFFHLLPPKLVQPETDNIFPCCNYPYKYFIMYLHLYLNEPDIGNSQLNF